MDVSELIARYEGLRAKHDELCAAADDLDRELAQLEAALPLNYHYEGEPVSLGRELVPVNGSSLNREVELTVSLHEVFPQEAAEALRRITETLKENRLSVENQRKLWSDYCDFLSFILSEYGEIPSRPPEELGFNVFVDPAQ